MLEDTFPFLFLSYFIYIGIILMWMNDVRNKVVSRKTNLYFTLSGFCLIGLQLVRLCKYQLFAGFETATYLMYSVPADFVILTLFFMLMLSVSIGEPDDGKWLNKYHLIFIPVFIVSVVMWTNEIHHLFYIHAEDGTWHRNVFYFVYYVLVIFMISLALITFYRKCSVWPGKHYFWIPLSICAVLWGLIIMAMTLFRTVYMWYDLFVGVIIFATESCIAIGMIPTCSGYDMLFDRCSLAMELRDKNDVVYQNTSVELREQDENTLRHSMEIRGGSIVWNEDISQINELYESISKTLTSLKENRDIILAEKEMEKRSEEYTLKSAIYDDISKSVNRKIEIIREEIEGGKDLKKIMICGVYIKRKANLMLVAADKGEISAGELFLSVKDTLTYIDDDIDKKVVIKSKDLEARNFPAPYIMGLFDRYDKFLNDRYKDLTRIRITIDADDRPFLIMDIKAKGEDKRFVIH